MLELREVGRRAEMGAARTRRGHHPFMEVGGKRRRRGSFNGRP
jgi:hypothetical protein